MRNEFKSNTINIDLNEINKFNNAALLWWKKRDKFKSLHQINPLRLNYILQHSNGLFNKKVLDIGCGGGILSESMAREGAKVTGIDVAKELLKTAHLHAFKNNIHIRYLEQTIEEHAQQYHNYYDVITCMEVLEHVPNPLSLIQGCAAVIKKNGHVYFSTINRNFKSWIYSIIGAEYLFKLLPKKTHNFNKFIKPSELLNWIDTTPLQEQNIVGICYNPIINSFYLCNKIDVNYIIYAKHD
ncbi:bifunctional 2-polyprenyl-6-hydroxyphenol methylase/3-demethylubiquinol 3-O-methyltransferase UbiG [Blochmannia endosymbiont of Colobopsis nipponica]|uniref:bifunctional 2-polyprenyl-6-hydroxyphenol methylase/3-demethylubiquinol 3-O-methyltransferase UbiG n=1 Tax=Blochmannia endosymbiont of Colobopsis nipponica TaxID=2681987 RepID=UPI001783023A|nr:bifunctional 2-polyprenyl-6-hydroxyphenol methylase/3-demethylubiquinol 3-O-methyltransferase UbiG [Blochmannia endosymbiont of Colobopsis nipponica]QOI11352.1 bifunctional 2-polyprenyl-6-hydroxyphenol methylase/3-demethylubiquinol 3-O-methyltransferase UbiG [Blochmannia endosymbiont of Colobopsis nipponica]